MSHETATIQALRALLPNGPVPLFRRYLSDAAPAEGKAAYWAGWASLLREIPAAEAHFDDDLQLRAALLYLLPHLPPESLRALGALGVRGTEALEALARADAGGASPEFLALLLRHPHGATRLGRHFDAGELLHAFDANPTGLEHLLSLEDAHPHPPLDPEDLPLGAKASEQSLSCAGFVLAQLNILARHKGAPPLSLADLVQLPPALITRAVAESDTLLSSDSPPNPSAFAHDELSEMEFDTFEREFYQPSPLADAIFAQFLARHDEAVQAADHALERMVTRMPPEDYAVLADYVAAHKADDELRHSIDALVQAIAALPESDAQHAWHALAKLTDVLIPHELEEASLQAPTAARLLCALAHHLAQADEMEWLKEGEPFLPLFQFCVRHPSLPPLDAVTLMHADPEKWALIDQSDGLLTPGQLHDGFLPPLERLRLDMNLLMDPAAPSRRVELEDILALDIEPLEHALNTQREARPQLYNVTLRNLLSRVQTSRASGMEP